MQGSFKNKTLLYQLAQLVLWGVSIYWIASGRATAWVLLPTAFLLLAVGDALLFHRHLWRMERRLKEFSSPDCDPLPGAGFREQTETLFAIAHDYIGQRYSAETAMKQMELNALQSQINPHFLYNTLEAIRGEAVMQGVEELADMTEALADFFRYSISRKGNLVTLGDELQNMHNYYLIQKFRFQDRIRIELSLEPGQELENCVMPKLVIQPIVENAIVHGLETKTDTGTVTVTVGRTDRRLELVISDDGKGMSPEAVHELNRKIAGPEEQSERASPKQGGIALRNVYRRIKMHFGEDSHMHVYSTEGYGTDVVISFPVRCSSSPNPEDVAYAGNR